MQIAFKLKVIDQSMEALYHGLHCPKLGLRNKGVLPSMYESRELIAIFHAYYLCLAASTALLVTRMTDDCCRNSEFV
jgi:hypothetical protein